jgi:RimJ/RimL family protein N-acetyltransferase
VAIASGGQFMQIRGQPQAPRRRAPLQFVHRHGPLPARLPGEALPSNPRIRLRPTMLSDLDFVITVETDGHNLPFITPWERTQHEGAVRIPDFRHFIVEGGDDYASVGFVILQGCRNPQRSVELKRLVLQVKGQGLGRACVRLLKQMAFRDLQAHRFWLDVKQANRRALALYSSEGFVVEGTLRESVRVSSDGADGYDSLVVMSMLDREYQARVALDQEGA